MRPVELARFAPLAFEAEAHGDDVARQIVVAAGDALAATLGAVTVPDIRGPLVLSGSILSRQPSVADRVVRSFDAIDGDPHVIIVPDGLVGAAVLALRHGAVPVDDTVFARVQTSLAALR
jgi:N-acetylglucosamine kinase-like BadF-type ATPase